jgi:hypothetical protein
MPGKRDYITVKDDDGETITLQKRILLNSVRETYELFLSDNNITNASLSLNSFGNVRPLNVLLYSHMPHRSCLCHYHENVNLLLIPLSKCIRSSNLDTLQAFSSALVCNEEDENCMLSRCSLCANNFDDKIQKNVIDPTEQIKWYQWVFNNGYAEKKEFNSTVQECLRPTSHPKIYFCLRASKLNETFRVDVSWAGHFVVKISARNIMPFKS